MHQRSRAPTRTLLTRWVLAALRHLSRPRQWLAACLDSQSAPWYVLGACCWLLAGYSAHPGGGVPWRRVASQEVTRNRTDMWNAAIGGCVAGATVGLHRKSLGSTAFGCLAFGAAAGLTDVYVACVPSLALSCLVIMSACRDVTDTAALCLHPAAATSTCSRRRSRLHRSASTLTSCRPPRSRSTDSRPASSVPRTERDFQSISATPWAHDHVARVCTCVEQLRKNGYNCSIRLYICARATATGRARGLATLTRQLRARQCRCPVAGGTRSSPRSRPALQAA